MDDKSYHIDYFPPNDVWPKGGWSVYQINGDQIADRIVRERVNAKGGYYEGKVIARHSWCGYLGISPTLEGVVGLIKGGHHADEAGVRRRRRIIVRLK